MITASHDIVDCGKQYFYDLFGLNIHFVSGGFIYPDGQNAEYLSRTNRMYYVLNRRHIRTVSKIDALNFSSPRGGGRLTIVAR